MLQVSGVPCHATHEFMAGARKPTSWKTSRVRWVFTLRVLATFKNEKQKKREDTTLGVMGILRI